LNRKLQAHDTGKKAFPKCEQVVAASQITQVRSNLLLWLHFLSPCLTESMTGIDASGLPIMGIHLLFQLPAIFDRNNNNNRSRWVADDEIHPPLPTVAILLLK